MLPAFLWGLVFVLCPLVGAAADSRLRRWRYARCLANIGRLERELGRDDEALTLAPVFRAWDKPEFRGSRGAAEGMGRIPAGALAFSASPGLAEVEAYQWRQQRLRERSLEYARLWKAGWQPEKVSVPLQ